MHVDNGKNFDACRDRHRDCASSLLEFFNNQ